MVLSPALDLGIFRENGASVGPGETIHGVPLRRHSVPVDALGLRADAQIDDYLSSVNTGKPPRSAYRNDVADL
jgi:hypothetical protein